MGCGNHLPLSENHGSAFNDCPFHSFSLAGHGQNRKAVPDSERVFTDTWSLIPPRIHRQFWTLSNLLQVGMVSGRGNP